MGSDLFKEEKIISVIKEYLLRIISSVADVINVIGFYLISKFFFLV
jgi:hypothetical protein